MEGIHETHAYIIGCVDKRVMFWDEEEKRSVPKAVLKKLVYDRDKGICRLCGNPVHPYEAEIGHNKAHSKGGKLTLKNALLLHPACNRSMRTSTLRQARASIGLGTADDETKQALRRLPIGKLKFLAKKHGLKVKGTVEEGWFSDSYKSPSKTRFVNALSKLVKPENIEAELKEMPAPKKRRQRKQRGLFDW